MCHKNCTKDNLSKMNISVRFLKTCSKLTAAESRKKQKQGSMVHGALELTF